MNIDDADLNWKSKIIAHDLNAEFDTASDEARIAAAEKALQVEFPSDLKSFLLEANGLVADYGSEVIWKLSDIVDRNNEFRKSKEFAELYMPFDHLLFFGNDGSGDQFALAIQADGVLRNPNVYRWDHETESRSWFASGLAQFLEKRLVAAD